MAPSPSRGMCRAPSLTLPHPLHLLLLLLLILHICLGATITKAQLPSSTPSTTPSPRSSPRSSLSVSSSSASSSSQSTPIPKARGAVPGEDEPLNTTQSPVGPRVESASYSTRRATVVAGLGFSDPVITLSLQFIDIVFSEPLYARVDEIWCPTTYDSQCEDYATTSCGASTDYTCDPFQHHCVELGDAPVRITSNVNKYEYFSIRIPACTSVLVYVRPISGDPDLYLSQTSMFPNHNDKTWSSWRGSNLLPEWYFFCCGQPLYASGDRLYASVYSYSNTTYDFYVRDARAPLPIAEFFTFSNMRLQCPSTKGVDPLDCQTQIPTPTPGVDKCGISQGLPATDFDYSRVSIDSNPLVPDVEFMPVEGLYVAYQLVSVTTSKGITTTLFPYDFAKCSASFTNLYNSNGEQLVDTFNFTLLEPPCEETAMKKAADRINQLGNLYNNASTYMEFRKIQSATLTYTTGDTWYACMKLANTYLQTNTIPVTQPTTRCTETFGSASFSADPCCSTKAMWNSSCLSQTKSFSVRAYSVDKDRVEDTCTEIPGCIYLSLSDWALFRQREDSISTSCATATQLAVTDLGSTTQFTLDRNCMAVTTGVTCYGTSMIDCGLTRSFCSIFHRCSRSCFVDSDCPYGQHCQWGYCETPYENAKQVELTTQCMVTDMELPLRQHLLAQSNLSSATPDSTFLSAFRQQFTQDKCRGGPEIDSYIESQMASQCTDILSCNWGPCNIYPVNSDRSGCQNACLNKRPPFGPSDEDHFCGVCQSENPESCFEISEWTGCYVRDPDVYRMGCGNIGAFSNDIESECIFDSASKPTNVSCLDPFFCPYTREELGLYGSVRRVCDGYCYEPAFTNEADCYRNCFSKYGTCWWTGTVCMVKDYTTASVCLQFGASWWPTHVWKEGFLQTQSECETGYCYPHLGQDQAACVSKSYCTAPCPANSEGKCTNRAECTSSGFCSDQELIHPDPSVDGVCVYSYPLSSPAGLPYCLPYTMQGRKGCIDYSITSESACLSLAKNYTMWLRPATTRSECEGHGVGCREAKYSYRYSQLSSPGGYFLSPKNTSHCLAAGGTPEPYYSWHAGSWVSGGRWQPLHWKQRQWLQLNQRIVQDFSFEKWGYEGYPEAFVKLFLPIVKSDQYCRYNRIIDVLSKISCSCAAPVPVLPYLADSPCSVEPKILVGVAMFCAGFDFELAAAPTGRLYVDKDVKVSPQCTEVRIFSLSASQLQRNDPTYFFSDIYVRTLAITPSNYSIIENKHKVVVAQIIGDGAQFMLYNTESGLPQGVNFDPYKGNITLCLYKRPDIALESKFRKFGFASASSDLSTFDILNNWNVWTVTQGTDLLVCSTLPYPLAVADTSAVFPIYRADDGWEDETFYSSQSVETVFFFFFAVGLYTLVLIANTIITGLLIVDYWKEIVRIRDSLSASRWKKAWRIFYDFFDMPRLIHMLIEVIVIDRIIYFSLLPTGLLNDQSSVVYIIMGELPIYLFFSIYTALVAFWVELVHFRFGLKRSQASTVQRIKMIFLGVNIFMYSLLVTLIIVFSVLEHYAPSSMNTCQSSAFLDGGETSEYETARIVLFIFYQCVVVVLALAISLGFLVYGTRLVILLYRTEAVNSKFSKLKRSKTIKFVTVMLVCTAALIALCAFLLYSAASETVEPVSAIVLIIIAEILPLALLTFSVGKSVPNLLSFCGRLDREPTSRVSSKGSDNAQAAADTEKDAPSSVEADTDTNQEESCVTEISEDNLESGDDELSTEDAVEMLSPRSEPWESRDESDEVRL